MLLRDAHTEWWREEERRGSLELRLRGSRASSREIIEVSILQHNLKGQTEKTLSLPVSESSGAYHI